MNIFYLDRDPEKCARFHEDKHCYKMIVEYAQLLSTAHRVLDGTEIQGVSKSGRKQKQWKLNNYLDQVMYKASHVNHPSAVWVRQSKRNYYWLYELMFWLSQEYTSRYGKVHKTWRDLSSALVFAPTNSPDAEYTDPPLCMPDYCKLDDAVLSYRKLYREEKSSFAQWNHSPTPEWYNA